jgi:outer membrane protein TolC
MKYDHSICLIKMGLLCCLSFLLTAVKAQEARTLTLREAIDLGLKNSKQLKLSQARIEEAIAATHEAYERRLPEVTVSGSYLRMSKPHIDIKTTSNAGDSSAIKPVNVNQAMYGIANVSLPLFAGLKVKYGIESAKFLEKAARMDADNDKQEAILNTAAAWINLYKAGAAVRLVEDNLVQARQRDTDFVNLERNGLLARNDLLRAQQETSRLELSLLDAQNNWQLAMVNMDLMLGLPEKTILRPDSASLFQPGELKSLEEYEQLAVTNRYDVQALNYRRQAAEMAVKIARGDNYPSIAFTGGYMAAYIPNFLTITNALNAGIGLRYSLSSLWKNNSKIQQAKARTQQAAINAAILDDAIRLEVNKAYQDYLSGMKKIEVYNKALEQANENYRISKNKYNNNLLTLTDLLDADVSRLQSSLDLAFAKADLVLAWQTLLQKAGLLNQ